MTYRSLEVWRIARDLSREIHKVALVELPRFEMFEEGQQTRRSIKPMRSNLVEGYGRRRYQPVFIRFSTSALASAIETTDHLECRRETQSLQDRGAYESLHARLEQLGRKTNKLIQSVDMRHQSVREDSRPYGNARHSSHSASLIEPGLDTKDDSHAPDLDDSRSKIQDSKFKIEEPESTIQCPGSDIGNLDP